MGEALLATPPPRTFIRPSQIGDVYALSAHLRIADYDEVRSLGLRMPDALRTSFRNAVFRRTAFVDGEIAAMVGLGGPLLSDHGVPWLLTTPAVERVPIAFLKEGRALVAQMLALRPHLENRVLASYTRACRFLALLGFELDPPTPFGPHGALFRRFSLSRTVAERREHQTPVRRPGVPDRPFIVYTAGRSRTAWLSAFLSYGSVQCHNEVAIRFRNMEDVAGFFATGRTGSAETGAAPGWRLINHHVPGIRSVVVRRPIEEIIASFARSEVAHIAAIDEDRLRRVITYEDRCLRRISAQPGTLTVDFADLGHADTCARVFEHCLPYRFDPQWWGFLRGQNIQADVADLFSYYRDNRDAIEGFKRAAKRDLTALARAHAFTPQV